MPLLFFLAGLILIVTGINGTLGDAGKLLKNDFTGPGNFFTWFFAILFCGMLGYIPTLKPISYGFLVLVFIAILLTSGSGFFDQLRYAMNSLTDGGIGDGDADGAYGFLNTSFDFNISSIDMTMIEQALSGTSNI